MGSVLGRFGGREITTTIPPSLLVACDSALLGQARINLVENAIKYSPPGAALLVEARVAPAPAIRDRARGRSRSTSPTADRVYPTRRRRKSSRFYRAHAHEGGGVGLGLTFARGIVGAHHGTLLVHDRDGGGATFRVEIPRADGSAEELP